MESIIWSNTDYSIFRVDAELLYTMASFVVMENYNHHSSSVMNNTVKYEIDKIYMEELLYVNYSRYYIVRDKKGKMVGCIRVFKWDKKTPTPMQRVFHICPLTSVENNMEASFWHIGRFAISAASEFSTIILFKQLMALAITPILQEKNSYMIAETDRHLLRVMNMLGIETRQLATSMTYLASETIPICASRQGLTKFYKKYSNLIA